ncbi:MAG: sulfatase-like hydrolase/transferase [Candidatus Eisenbacteria bacterium]|nr:sulfatase-like hydrolase/transferase [Candidatus Eisenbacteria bacterium]
MIRGVIAVSLSIVAACLGFSCGGCSEASSRPNMVIVVLDAVRRDHVGAEIPGSDGRSVTPNVDRLAAHGTTYSNAWANGPWTLPSHVSMFTGLLPSRHGCTGAGFRFESDEPTFAELLDDAGYETVAFYSNPWLSDALSGMMRGFDHQYVDPGSDLSILSSGSQGGAETLERIERWLDGRDGDRPFLMFVNFLEAHLPYDPPSSYREEHLADIPDDEVVSVQWAHEVNARVRRPESDEWERVRRLYAGDVHASDALFGALVSLLEGKDLYDDAFVVVTSDHGENLGDHGFTDHQFGVFESLLAVPLVAKSPGSVERDAGERDDPVMLTDLFPTVLELAGVAGAPPRRHARSLLAPPSEDDRLLIAEYVVPGLLRDHIHKINPSLEEPWLYASYATVRSGDVRLTIGSDGSVELTDYSDDPLRREHLEERGRELAEELDGVLPAPGSPSEGPHIDPELRETLRSLGYVH